MKNKQFIDGPPAISKTTLMNKRAAKKANKTGKTSQGNIGKKK